MTMHRDPQAQAWSPRFIDYVFLAFNTSTALSPTDVPVLSRWAKMMVMVQALISLSVIAILVGAGRQYVVMIRDRVSFHREIALPED